MGMILVLLVLALGCASTTSNYDKRYNKVWKELIKSQAWKDALENREHPHDKENAVFYVSTEDKAILDKGNVYGFVADDQFSDKYNRLIVRAYEKIIAEASAADGNLEKEYLQWNDSLSRTKKSGDKKFRQNLAEINKRFQAHRKMLEGLKSWNIFSDQGSNDMDFFRAENKNRVFQMYKSGENESKMVSFLVYKLADLYHFEN